MIIAIITELGDDSPAEVDRLSLVSDGVVALYEGQAMAPSISSFYNSQGVPRELDVRRAIKHNLAYCASIPTSMRRQAGGSGRG